VHNQNFERTVVLGVATQKDSIVAISPLAGNPAPKELLVDVTRLEQEYF
jgi:hypothetical protein